MGEGASSFITGLLIAVLAGFVIMFVIRRLLPAFSGAGQASSGAPMQRAPLEQAPRSEPGFNPASNAFGGTSAEPEPFKSYHQDSMNMHS